MKTKADRGVPLLDLGAQYQSIKSEVLTAVEAVFERQQFILGREVEALEKVVADYCQVKHAIGCASGSDALLLALMAIGIEPGDEVITSAFTFFATGGSVARLGAKPVFVDIEPDTFNIDPNRIEAAITPKTKAIMPVHLFGQVAEMSPIMEIAQSKNIAVIEDAAQAIGAEYKGQQAGSIGEIGCLSFFPTKNLGGVGDGGMMLTNSDRFAEKLRALRVHGGYSEYIYSMIGCNSRLDEIQAAVLRVKMHYLESWSEARRKNASTYNELLQNYKLTERVKLPVVRPYCKHIFHQYTILAKDRDQLFSHLKEKKIGAKIYYPLSLHLQDCFAYLGYKAGELPNTERACTEVLSLPIYPELTFEQQEAVVSTIASFYNYS
ncbi:MAG: DegT/DnrJ/EryC1/StrS family aminotransferase [Blastocatellia bacterium]|nr:DegT/DnrJ/EryC1/StrS family aminotransferase [Blastocatellia bacterium]